VLLPPSNFPPLFAFVQPMDYADPHTASGLSLLWPSGGASRGGHTGSKASGIELAARRFGGLPPQYGRVCPNRLGTGYARTSSRRRDRSTVVGESRRSRSFSFLSTLSFSSLPLSEPVLRALAEEGYTTPTPIQAKSIP